MSTKLIQQIHDTATRLVLAITGGGSRAIAELLEVPGGSRTVLEAVVPYAATALADWLSAWPERSCNSRTARAMAMASYERAEMLASVPLEFPLAGVGATASLVSDRHKQGDHRIYVATQTATTTRVQSLVLEKDRRSRSEEERIATIVILNAVAEACGISDRLDLPLVDDEKLQGADLTAPLAWQELLAGKREVVAAGHEANADKPKPRAIFAGAFNPLHHGHQRMAQIAAGHLSLPIEFEISIDNVDKPPLDFLEMAARASQFSGGQRLWFTRAPTFVEKSRLFPQASFIVGLDTILRIADCRYYNGDEYAAQRVIDELASHGCRFLVFGRVADNQFQTLSDVALPPALAVLCQEVPASEFREDISSTELREKQED